MQPNMHLELESRHGNIARKWGFSTYSFSRFRFTALLALDCAEFVCSDAVLYSCNVGLSSWYFQVTFQKRKSVAPEPTELQNQDLLFSIYVAQCLDANISEESLMVPPVIPYIS